MQTLTKNRRVSSRGRSPGSRCGLKHANFYRPFFGFKFGDLPGRVSHNYLYDFSRPRHELKPQLVCFLARCRLRAQRPLQEKRDFSRGLLGGRGPKTTRHFSRTVYIYIYIYTVLLISPGTFGKTAILIFCCSTHSCRWMSKQISQGFRACLKVKKIKKNSFWKFGQEGLQLATTPSKVKLFASTAVTSVISLSDE